jgi:Rad3-related DNA helicase
MKQDHLSAAFGLIYEFRNGQFASGSELSPEHLRLLRLLCEDILPGEKFDEDALEELIPRLASTDSFWNKRTMALADEFYALSEAAKPEAAEQRLNEFLRACPSSWYRGIASSL